MKKIIINYDDNITEKDALLYTIAVVNNGRMSGYNNESYCYCTTFKDDTVVLADVTKSGTDKFTVRGKEQA